MISIGIRELRQHASRYAAWRRRVGESPSPSVARWWRTWCLRRSRRAWLAWLEAAGQYLPPVGSVLDLLPPPPVPQGKRPLSEVVQERRGQERG
jgi:hypothetical protein